MTKIIPVIFRLFYYKTVKPSIPETGTVIRLIGDVATVLLKGDAPCKGCGAGKIGLCRPAGNSMMIMVKNTAGARVGDIVMIGIDGKVQRSAYLLAYGAPLLSLLAGSFGGHLAAVHFRIPLLDAATGFMLLIVVSLYSFLRLRRLDRDSMMTVKRIVNENTFDAAMKTEEERLYECYAPGPPSTPDGSRVSSCYSAGGA